MIVKNNLLSASTILALFIGLNFVAIAKEPNIPYNSTTGTYQISVLRHLEELQDCVSGAGASQSPAWTSAGKTFILMDDITGFSKSIGTYDKPFMGTFDGNGHKITFSISSIDVTNTGVFGYTEGAVIKNLTTAGSMVYFHNYSWGTMGLGAIVGNGNNTNIVDCVNLTDITIYRHSVDAVGGIAGNMHNSTITHCSNVGNLTIADHGSITGGIVGYIVSGSLSGCVNIGTVQGIQDVGGIAGVFFSADHNITDCANAGWVSGNYYVGGIIGKTYGLAMMQNCLNTGVIQGNYFVYSLVGFNGIGSSLANKISNCYYDNQMSQYTGVQGMTNSAAGVYGLSTNELTRPWIKYALGDAWRIFPETFGGLLGNLPPNQVYSYPFVQTNNSYISYIAAIPARLSNNNLWNNVTSVIKLDILYCIYSTNGVVIHNQPSYGALYWEVVGGLTVPPLSTWITIVGSSNGAYAINAHNPSPGYSGLSTLIAYMDDAGGYRYKKTVPVFTIAPFKIPLNNYELYGFEASEVSPNIVTNNAVMDISSKVEGNLNVAIFDISGSKVMNVTDRHVTAQSQNQVELTNLSNLANGSYMVAVSVGSNVIFRRFIKQ